MEARLTALENRPRPTERALVVERFARQAGEVAQQTVGTWPSRVDAEEIGPPDVNGVDLVSDPTACPGPSGSHNPELLRKVQSDDGLDAAASGNERG